MTKELKTLEADQSCEVCGRTILKGERPDMWLAPGGTRRLVCELCFPRAEAEGWIREGAAGDTPFTARTREQRRSLIGRIRRRREDEEEPLAAEERAAVEEEAEQEPERPARAAPLRRRKDARHVRAVPTNDDVKVERALEIFNSSDFPRKIAGIQRSLGVPWVSALPDSRSPSEVTLVIAWELSWYLYRVDLGDAEEPVQLADKGLELSEIGEELQDWNASADADGRLAVGVGSEPE